MTSPTRPVTDLLETDGFATPTRSASCAEVGGGMSKQQQSNLLYQQKLEMAQTSSGLFKHGECIELMMYRLMEAIVTELIAKTGSDDAIVQAAMIVNVMRNPEGCNNGMVLLHEMQRIHEQLVRGDFDLALESTTTMITKLQPLRVQEIFGRLKQTEAEQPEIAGKDVVLMLGKTGAGKSTTVQFMAGLRMVRKATPGRSSNNKGHIESEFPGQGALKRVVASAAMRSETKELIPVEVVVRSSKPPLIVCDAPGFDDSGGVEAEIVAGHGVLEALRQAKSVRIFALQNKMDFGARGDGLRNLARILSQIIDNLSEDKMKAILFGFTRFDEKDDVGGLIDDVCKENTAKESLEFRVVVDALKDFREGGDDPLIVDPLGDEAHRKRLLKVVYDLKPIDSNDLRYSASRATEDLVERQLHVDYENLVWALRTDHMELAMQYFSNVQGLAALFPGKEASLKKSQEAIRYHFCNKAADVVTGITRRIDEDGLQILDEDLQMLRAVIDGCEKAVDLWGNQISDLPRREQVTAGLLDVLRRRRSAVLEKGPWRVDDDLVKTLLTTVTQLRVGLGDARLDTMEQDLIEELHRRVCELAQGASNALEAHAFDKLEGLLRELIGGSQSQEIREFCLTQIENTMDQLASSVAELIKDPCLHKRTFSTADVQSIVPVLDLLEAYEKSSTLQAFLVEFNTEKGKPQLPSPFAQAIQALRATFDAFAAKIKAGMSDSAKIDVEESEYLVGQMRLMREIPQLHGGTAELFHETISSFRGYIAHVQREAESVVSNITLSATAQKADYRRLERQLTNLKRVCELDKDNVARASVFSKITDEIGSAVTAARDRMVRPCKSFSIHRVRPSDLDEAVAVYNLVSDMEPLKDLVSEVLEGMLAVDRALRAAIDPICSHYANAFDAEALRLIEKKQRVVVLRNILDVYERVQASVQGQGYPSFDCLEQHLVESEAKLSEFIADRGASLDTLRLKYQECVELVRSGGEGSAEKIARLQALDAECKAHEQETRKQSGKQKAAIEEIRPLIRALQNQLEVLAVEEGDKNTLPAIKRNDPGYIQSVREELKALDARMSSCPPSVEYDFSEVCFDVKLANQALMVYDKLTFIHLWSTMPAPAGEGEEGGRSSSAVERLVPEKAEESLKIYISNYVIYFQQELLFACEKLQKCIRDCNKSDVLTLGGTIISCLTRLKALDGLGEDGVAAVLQSKASGYRDDIRSNLTIVRRLLSSTIDTASNEDNREQLATLVDISFALAELDHHCDSASQPLGESFRGLWDSSRKLMREENDVGLDVFRKQLLDHNFVDAAGALKAISRAGLKATKVASLHREFQQSLEKNMVAILDEAEQLASRIEEKLPDENNTVIKSLCASVARIKAASENAAVADILQGCGLGESLRKFVADKVKEHLSGKMSLGCERIKDMIDLDSFAKAEQWLENIQGFSERLSACIDTETVKRSIEAVAEKLDNLAHEIETRDAFSNISKWPEYSPKVLVATLVELQKVRVNTRRYANAKSNALTKTKECYEKKFDEILSTPDLPLMSSMRDELKRAREFLPDAHLSDFDARLTRLDTRIDLCSKNDAARLERALASLEKEDESNFGNVLNLYKEAVEKNPSSATIIQDGIMSRLSQHHREFDAFIESGKVPEALGKVTVILMFHRTFAVINDGTGSIMDAIIRSLGNHAQALSQKLRSFEENTPDIVLQAAANLICFLDWAEKNSSRPIFSVASLEDIYAALRSPYEVFRIDSTKFEESLATWDLRTVSTLVAKTQKWTKLQELLLGRFGAANSDGLLDVRRISLKLNNMLDNIRSHLKVTELLTETTKQFAEARLKAVVDFAKWYDLLTKVLTQAMFAVKLDDVDVKGFASFKQEVDKAIAELGKRLLDKCAQTNMSESECAEFKVLYELLSDMSKQPKLEKLSIGSNVVQVASEKILAKASAFRVQVEELSKVAAADMVKTASALIELKKLEQNLLWGSEIHQIIDEALRFFKEQQRQHQGIGKLAAVLGMSHYGNTLIAEHKALSGEDLRTRKEKMQKQDDLESMLAKLEGEGEKPDIEALRDAHMHYKLLYDEFLSKNLGELVVGSGRATDNAVSKAKELVRDTMKGNGTFSLGMPKSRTGELPKILACTCAVWTLLNTEDYNENRGNDRMAYVLTPHVAQIVSIFRIMGIGYRTKTHGNEPEFAPFLRHCLVEVGTGEGKSFILAMVASILALMGCEVDCSCYSEYLSQRDHAAFASVFKALGVEHLVHYNTFNKICEKVLNQRCNVRDQIRNAILQNHAPGGVSVKTKPSAEQKRVLLIDEVDVFLSDQFYGGMYVPSLLLPGGRFKDILDYIWEHRGPLNSKNTGFSPTLTIRDFRDGRVPAFAACISAHGKWETVIVEAIKDMIHSLKSFLTIHYRVDNNFIEYLDGEAYVRNINHGYETVWAYYYEFHLGKISAPALAANAGLVLNCGLFSYAEIPRQFAFISGVTGTLRTLSRAEHDILKHSYGIEYQTIMPSVFGANNRIYTPAADLRVVSPADHHDAIKRDVDEKCKARRAVLVFFPAITELMNFFNSPEFESFRREGNYQIIAENVTPNDREMRIKRSGTEGLVTLLTRNFGRGTDFICRNPQLLSNGGVHVLQTFYSEEKSEEYQIMGRGARQGDRGSYALILADQGLEWFLGPEVARVLTEAKTKGTPLHTILESERESKYNTKCASKAMGIEQRRHEHRESERFMEDILARRLVEVVSFMTNCNKASRSNGGSRTVLLMDATGSMSSSLEAAKETVCVMFERASSILDENGLDPSCFQMQFVVYRNYNSCVTGTHLQASAWESNPARLREFMSGIYPSGGWGNEAIELGLAHAADQLEEERIDQVILVGDMPPNTREEVRSRRASWFSVGVGSVPEAYWEDELKRLRGIPVHAFYVHPAAKDAFREIARRQSGRCERLDIDGTAGAEMLTAMVTEEILRKAGGQQGDKLVDAYRKKYSRSYTS